MDQEAPASVVASDDRDIRNSSDDFMMDLPWNDRRRLTEIATQF